MKIVTMGQGTAERHVPASDREVCISITTPGAPDAGLSAAFADVLRLQFDDIGFGGPCRAFDHRLASAVVLFLARHRDTAAICVIHCTVGRSRSVSVALAIEEAGIASYARPMLRPGEIPNPVIHRTMLDAIRRYGKEHELMSPAMERIEPEATTMTSRSEATP